MKVYGLWFEAGNRWLTNDDGSQFQTTDLDVALDAYWVFLSNGADGLEVREMPPDQVETFTIPNP